MILASNRNPVTLSILSAIPEFMRLMLRRPVRSQFAALCYRDTENGGGIEVLLVTSRDSGRWVIPKGWPMGNRPGYAVARQEAFEEAGIEGEVERAPLGSFTYEKAMPEGLKLPVEVQVHPLRVTGLGSEYKEKNIRRLAWVNCQEAANRVNEPELKALIRNFERRFIS